MSKTKRLVNWGLCVSSWRSTSYPEMEKAEWIAIDGAHFLKIMNPIRIEWSPGDVYVFEGY